MTNSQVVSILESQLDSYLSDLQLLAAMDSGPHNRAGANRVNDWIADRLQRSGFTIQRHAHETTGDTLVGILTGTGQRKILLLGHTDTVYPDGTGAERPIIYDGDKLLGPGTCDMKAGLLTGIYAVEALMQIGFDDFATITYLCVADEELAVRFSIDLIRQTVRGHDAALTLEAARENGDIVTERKGNVSLRLSAHGRSAHAGVEPEKGRNAIMGLVRKLQQVVTLAKPEIGLTINVGVIDGGTLPNVVPAQANATLDIRAFHKHELDEVVAQIKAMVAEPDEHDIHFTITHDYVSPAMPRTDEIVHLENLAKQAANELGFEVRGASTGGAADAAFAAAEGVPALDGLGPVGGLDHSPDEYILKSSIVPRTALLAHLIMLICGE